MNPNYLKSYALGVLLALMFLSACATTASLDTTNKKFAAFEISYKSALVEIDALDKSDSFKPETRAKVAALLTDVNDAKTLAYTAKGTGDLRLAENQLSLAIRLLDRLKATLPAGGKI